MPFVTIKLQVEESYSMADAAVRADAAAKAAAAVGAKGAAKVVALSVTEKSR